MTFPSAWHNLILRKYRSQKQQPTSNRVVSKTHLIAPRKVNKQQPHHLPLPLARRVTKKAIVVLHKVDEQQLLVLLPRIAIEKRLIVNPKVASSSYVENTADRKEPGGTSSTSARETHHDAPASTLAQHSMEQYTSVEQRYANIDSQNKEFRDHLKKNQAALTSLQAKLAEAEAHGASLQQRLEEASNTIFRLRPQRQECTESEIEEDYRELIFLVKNWISVNCESFLDDDLRGFDTIGSYGLGTAAYLGTFEAIMLQFHSESSRWIEAKEHVLVAVVMRYLFTQILNQSFSVLLSDGERDFLTTIQNSMENMELQKGKFVVLEACEM